MRNSILLRNMETAILIILASLHSFLEFFSKKIVNLQEFSRCCGNPGRQLIKDAFDCVLKAKVQWPVHMERNVCTQNVMSSRSETR